jgi:hypothetical protein
MTDSLYDPAGLAAMLARLDRLQPTASRQWGKMTAAQMLANDLDEGKAKPILAKGENLANLTLGTEDRAEKTKEFLDELFALLGKLV